MLAYCVNHLSSLKASLVSEHFGGNNSKIKKGGHITELRQIAYLSLRTSVGCRSRSPSGYLSLLLFGLLLCFTLCLKKHCYYRLSIQGADYQSNHDIMSCVCTVPWKQFSTGPWSSVMIYKDCTPTKLLSELDRNEFG